MRLVFALFIFACSVLALPNADTHPCGANVSILQPGHLDFKYWDNVLTSLVTVNATIDSVVLNAFNYSGLTGNKDFETFGCQVENALNVTQFNESEWKAFWINVYNFLAIRSVYKHACAIDLFGDCRPLASIKEIEEQQPSLFDIIWDIPSLSIKGFNDGNLISLNDIENNNLRMPSQFVEDVRLHGCIVCASVSCPDLHERAYTVEKIDEMMDQNVRKWLANPAKGTYVSGNVITLSTIFKWFADDFNNVSGTSNSPNLTYFLKVHAPENVVQALSSNSHSFAYFTYNWNLNGNIQGLCSVNRPCFPWWALLTLVLGLVVVTVVGVCCVKKRKTGYMAINN